jgi:hypothetical protein
VQFNDLAQFVLYVIPGFVALEIYRHVYPVKTRSDFIVVTWSIVFGLMISFSLIWINENLFGSFFRFVPNELPSIGFLLALLSCGIVLGLIRVLLRKLRTLIADTTPFFQKLNPDPQNVWYQVNQAKEEYWAVVFLDDESIYLGYIKTFRSDPDKSEQDFLLSHASRVDDHLRVMYEVDGLGVYLNTKNVKRIEYYAGTTNSARNSKRKSSKL